MFMVPTRFMAGKLIEGGIASNRIVVRNNCLSSDPGLGTHESDHALFVGRVSPEKGISTMLRAWELLRLPMRLRIVGGPVPSNASSSATRAIEWAGARSRSEVIDEMQRAKMLIFPSVWYEGQPLVLLEALATGLPVVASDIGAMREMFAESDAGQLFPASDAKALAGVVDGLQSDSGALKLIGGAARAEYLRRYTPDRGYATLMDVYEQAIQRSRALPRGVDVLTSDPRG
jgi:glycosyltransferase involved in cell wall biosynthesis